VRMRLLLRFMPRSMHPARAEGNAWATAPDKASLYVFTTPISCSSLAGSFRNVSLAPS
jgi:hypothetical protein